MIFSSLKYRQSNGLKANIEPNQQRVPGDAKVVNKRLYECYDLLNFGSYELIWTF